MNTFILIERDAGAIDAHRKLLGNRASANMSVGQLSQAIASICWDGWDYSRTWLEIKKFPDYQVYASKDGERGVGERWAAARTWRAVGHSKECGTLEDWWH